MTCDGHPVSIPEKKTKTIFPVSNSELGCTSAHAFATHCGLRGSQSSVLPVCNHMRTSRRNICPMHSHSSTWAGCQRHQINWEHYFRNRDPQAPRSPGSCASYVGTTSLLFRDILPTWVLRARQTAKPGHFRSDMTFRQAMEHSGDSSKTVSFLTLWDDVIGVPPNPKLYVYQRPIPGCRCGTKGLRVFARRVARGALTVFIW